MILIYRHPGRIVSTYPDGTEIQTPNGAVRLYSSVPPAFVPEPQPPEFDPENPGDFVPPSLGDPMELAPVQSQQFQDDTGLEFTGSEWVLPASAQQDMHLHSLQSKSLPKTSLQRSVDGLSTLRGTFL